MAVDQSSVPKDLRASAAPGRVHPTSYWDPTAPSPGGSSFFSATADHPSPRKVKLLCSFGGRILPRPSDGALRYAGGQTRIISLRKDVTFLDFAAKMAEAMGAVAVAVKYQLPGEDLDALISVSCPEDLVNMMDEYEKLAAASPDGSFKLRAFLFSPSELASVESALHHGAIGDAGQSYVEAINGFGVFDAARGPLRRDSVASAASSAQNSEGTGGGDAVEDGSAEVMSPSFPSHAVDSEHDASRLVYAGGSNPNMPSDGHVEIPDPAGVLAPGIGFPDQNPTLARPDQSPMAPSFISPAHKDPHQLHCVTPQHSGMVGGLQHINVGPLTMHSYVHGALPTPSNILSPASQVNYLQQTQARFAPNLENQYGGKVPQTAGDQNMKAFQPLSQLPPLPPKHLQPYLLQPLSPSRLEDCLMCQKALPHAHSDTLVQEHDVRSLDSLDKASSMFYSQRSEDISKYRAAPVATGALANNIPELSAESMSAVSQFSGSLPPHNPEVHHANLVNKAAISPSAIEMMMPSGDSLSNQNLLGNNYVQGQYMNPLLQHQHIQQPLVWNTWQPPQYLVKQEIVTGLPNDESLFSHQLQTVQPHKLMVRQEGVVDPSESGSFKNVNFHNAEPTAHDFVRQFTDSSVLPMTSRIESLCMNPHGPSETFHQGIPALSQVDAPNYLVVENGHNVRSQFRDNSLFIGHDGVNYRFVPEETYTKPMEQPPFASSQVMQLQSRKNVEATQAVNMTQNHDPYPQNLGMAIEGSVPYQNFNQMPIGFNNTNTIPAAGLPVDSSQFHLTAKHNDFAPSPGSIPLSSLSNSREHVEDSHDQMPSDVDFSDQAPWEVLGDANMLPPKPSRIVGKEFVVTNDYSAANHFTNGSDIVAMLEEGNLYHPSHTVLKEPCLEPISLTKVPEEERIKQQLQAVAEDVAAAVFQPSETFETTNLPTEANTETWSNKESKEVEKVAHDEEVEEFMDKKLDKEIPSVHLNEDMGHLQIIQNGDLEELQELGSGTFGTVFHGKWRGSDVAIKRINDRCFSAKKSEEERMRADFWNEARKLADLHHPNVVAFYGVVLDGPGGSIATVTEYMVNGSLRQALQRNAKAFDQRKRLLVAMDVAFGMEYLHAKNIIHFDIKSDNLLVNLRDPQRPICKVGDLGLSKVKCKTLISGGMRGTLPWMAPELLYGNDSLVSEKVDVFSFGVVMWEMLTGEEPYADLHYGTIIGGILSNTLRPTVPESCDPEWRSLMEQCWSAEPLERPNFTEIANRLRCMTAALAQKVQPQAHK